MPAGSMTARHRPCSGGQTLPDHPVRESHGCHPCWPLRTDQAASGMAVYTHLAVLARRAPASCAKDSRNISLSGE
jgi:hypothetical protein